MEFTYQTIKGQTTAEFRDRGSKFLAYAYPATSADEVKQLILGLKKEHPKAVHHCYAYRFGTDGLQYRANDDGEPSGSAGKPILGQIDSAGLTDTLVVVVRYFGGTLLGVPGLINAYKTCTAEALALAEKETKNIEERYNLEFDYTIMNDVMMVLKQYEVSIYKQDMHLFCYYTIGIPLKVLEVCMERLKDIRNLEVSKVARA